MTTHRGPGKRAGLSREAVLAAAHEVLVADGLEGLTMRALARRLDVAPNALYSHVANKTALVDALLDDLLAQVVPPAPDVEDPVEGLAALMTSSYRVLTRHPELVPAYLVRQGARGPNAVRLGEIVTGLLARIGVTGSAATQARRVLIVHAIGSAAFTGAPDADRPVAVEESAADAAAGLRWLLAGIAATAAR